MAGEITRILENGDTRITEASDVRILEQVTPKIPAGTNGSSALVLK